MNDRQRLEAIINVIGQYLPPDGIPVNDAMSEIISLVDPLPPQRTWVGLTDEEYKFVLAAIAEAEWMMNTHMTECVHARDNIRRAGEIVEAKLKEST